MAMSAAGSPNRTETPRQPTAAMRNGPASATTTVPTLPPEMWALIAKPRRSGGNCSARSPLPTGCWGDPPIRDTTFVTANAPNDGASPCAANPTPNRMPPIPISQRRGMWRVRTAKLAWTSPEPIAPAAATNVMAPTPTPNSSMTARKIIGRITAWAWFTAWAIDRSHRVRCGWISGGGAAPGLSGTARGSHAGSPGGGDRRRARTDASPLGESMLTLRPLIDLVHQIGRNCVRAVRRFR